MKSEAENTLKVLKINNWSTLLIGIPNEHQDKIIKFFDEAYLIQEPQNMLITLAVIRRLFERYSQELNVVDIVNELYVFKNIFEPKSSDPDHDYEMELVCAFEAYYVALLKQN